jgi:hypothetical protein
VYVGKRGRKKRRGERVWGMESEELTERKKLGTEESLAF